MKVIVRRIGAPAAVATNAVISAAQGTSALSNLLAPETFADLCILTIDYIGDGITPVLTVDAVKWARDGRRLELKPWHINLDDIFGIQSDPTDSILTEIVEILKSLMEEMYHDGPPPLSNNLSGRKN